MAGVEKAPGAFKTIGELSTELGIAQHILRYWESKFPQLRPLQRAGNRRYYRPADVDLARRIHRLLNEEGYTVKGVQKLLRSRDGGEEGEQAPQVPLDYVARPLDSGMPRSVARAEQSASPVDVERLVRIRDSLISALED
jgi:DNA-binding transcriptional MerR regulator